MGLDGRSVKVLLYVRSASGRSEDVDDLTLALASELRQSDLCTVESTTDPASSPRGTKAADVITLGALAVAVLPSLFQSLVELVKSWSLRGENRSVKLKVQVGDQLVEMEYSPKDLTSDEIQRLAASVADITQHSSHPRS